MWVEEFSVDTSHLKKVELHRIYKVRATGMMVSVFGMYGNSVNYQYLATMRGQYGEDRNLVFTTTKDDFKFGFTKTQYRIEDFLEGVI